MAKTDQQRPIAHLTSGAISGMTACMILQPLDLLKTRLQQSNPNIANGVRSSIRPRSTVVSTIRDIVKTNGLGGLWRGTLPTVARNVPATAMYFTTLSQLRPMMKVSRNFIQVKDQEKWESLVAGAAARGAVGFMTMPVTVIKVRYESNLYNYKSLTDAFRSIIKYDGFRGLFAGYGATFIRDAPFAGIYLFFYEHCKGLGNAWKKNNDIPIANLAINLGSGVIAGTAATCVTQPFDMMKTRMQLKPTLYRNIGDTARKIYMEKGIRGFFDGILLRLTRKPLSSAISWAVYEEIMRFNVSRNTLPHTTIS